MPSSSIKDILIDFLQKLKSFLFTKDVLSFLLFLFLSSGLWFLNVLDKVRETTILLPVEFPQIPPEIEFIQKLPKSIEITIEDEGLNLLKYNREDLKNVHLYVNENFAEKGVLFVDNQELIKQISANIFPTTTLLSVNPFEIRCEYIKLKSKTVPVKLNENLQTESQYFQTNTPELSPRLVTVYGSNSFLENIEFVETKMIELSQINDTVASQIELKKIKGVKIYPSHVNVKFFVEMFTEKKMSVPVKVINLPENMEIRTFPAIVDLTFNVGLSYFNQLKSDDIELTVDYNDLTIAKNEKGKIQVANHSTHITNIRLLTTEVEYLLESK